MPETDDGKVTLAIVGNDVKHLQTDFIQFRDEVRVWMSTHSGRHDRYDECQDALCSRVTRNEERLRTTTGLLAGLQVVLATVAAAVGAWFK